MLPHLCPFSSIKLAVNSRQTCLHLGACATQAGELRSSSTSSPRSRGVSLGNEEGPWKWGWRYASHARTELWRFILDYELRVVPHFSSGIVERAKREGAWKSPHARKARRGIFLSPRRVSPFSRGVIFTRARVSLALLSPRKNGGLLVVYFILPQGEEHKGIGLK